VAAGAPQLAKSANNAKIVIKYIKRFINLLLISFQKANLGLARERHEATTAGILWDGAP
jgi:hypothetical protein